MAQPAMQAITHAFPDDDVALTGKPWLADLLPFLNLGSARYVESAFRADKAWLFRNSFSAAWQVFRARIPIRYGFAHDGRSLLLKPAVQPTLDMRRDHHRRYFLDLVRQAGIAADDDAPVSLRVPEAERRTGLAMLQTHGLAAERCICVAPGAQFGSAKRYPEANYRRILQRLSHDGWHILVIGTPAETAIAKHCLRQCKGPVWNACGQTSLRQALQLLAASRLLLCNDSGMMHVAAGFGMPVVAIFGATDPQRTAPDGQGVQLLYEPAACSPCLQRECTVEGHPCMANIDVETVITACQRTLT